MALAIYRCERGRGGAENYTLDLAKSLVERGIHVSVVSTTEERQGLPDRVEWSPVAAGFGGRLWKYRCFARGVEAFRQARTGVLVHAMTPVPTCGVYQPHAGLLAGRARLGGLAARLAYLASPKRRYVVRMEARMLACQGRKVVACLSGRMREESLALYPKVAARVVEHGVPLERFQPSTREPGEQCRFVFIGRDWERKGAMSLLRAAALVPEAELVLVGGDDLPRWQAAAAKAGVGGRVAMKGPTPRPEDGIRGADVLVLPSHIEPWGLVAMEAIACGVPVIVSRESGVSELVERSQCGLVVADPGDAQQLAEAMRRMLPAEPRKAMRDRCAGIRDSISWDGHVRAMVDTYNDVMNEAKHGGRGAAE